MQRSVSSKEKRCGSVVDFVFESGGVGERRREGCMGMECPSPRRMVVRWFSRLRKTRRRNVDAIECSIDVDKSSDRLDSVPENNDSGSHTREVSFNTGLGMYFVYLIAAGNDEIRKMVELRGEMEKLLETAKEELRRKESPSKPPPPPNKLHAYSIIDAPKASESDNGLSPQVVLDSFSESLISVVCDQSTKCNASTRGHSAGEMDQLEAELEAELKLLQLQLEPENKRCTYRREQQREKVTAKDAVLSTSHSLSFGEVIDPEASSSKSAIPYSGVSPFELERKLHELIETRQQEQITELEAALKRANEKLCEKEAEITWWKDTAHLFSQRIPQSSQLSSKHLPEIHPMSR